MGKEVNKTDVEPSFNDRIIDDMMIYILTELSEGISTIDNIRLLCTYLNSFFAKYLNFICECELYANDEKTNQIINLNSIKNIPQAPVENSDYYYVEKCFLKGENFYFENGNEIKLQEGEIAGHTISKILLPIQAAQRIIGVLKINKTTGISISKIQLKLINITRDYISHSIENIFLKNEIKLKKDLIENNEKEYHDLLSNLSEMVVIHIDGRLVEVNEAAARFTGYTREDFIKYLFDRIIDKKSLPQVLEKINERKKGIISEEYSIEIITKAGDKKTVLIKSSFIQYKYQRAVLVTFKDVTENRKLEAMISYKRDQLVSLMENIPDASIYFKDTESRFTRINKAQAKLIGVNSPDDAIGKTDFDYFPVELAKEFYSDEKKIIQKEIPLVTKLERHVRNGNVIWLNSTKVPVYNKDKIITGLVGISHDVTKFKMIEEEIKKSEEQFRSIWENSFDGMSLIDENGTTILVNNSFCKMVGMERDELIGKDSSIIYSEDYQWIMQRNIIERIKNRNTNLHIERKTELWNNKVIWLDISHSFLYSEKNTPLLLSIFRDITERKFVENQLSYRTELEMIVSTISTSFIHFSPEEINDGINRTLIGIGNFFRVDRCYIFLISNDRMFLSNEFEWCNKGIESQKEDCSRIPIINFQWILSKLYQSEIIRTADINSLIDITEVESRFLKKRGTKSLILVPMVFSKELKGFFGFDFVQNEMSLQEEDFTMLETIADIFIFSIERKRVEDAIKFEKEELSVTLRSIGDGVITTDINENIKIINKAAQEILGWPESDVIGKPVYNLFQLIQNSLEITTPNISGNTLINFSQVKAHLNEYIEVITKQGNRKTIFIYSTNLKDPNGILSGFVYVIRDVTEQLKIEKQLLISQKMESIGNLAAGIAHEINTPMQYINDNTLFLKDSFTVLMNYLATVKQILSRLENEKTTKNFINIIEQKENELDVQYLVSEIPMAIQQSQTGIDRVTKIILAMKDFAHPSSKNKTYSDINHAIEVTTTISKNEWKYVAELELKLAPNLPLVNCIVDEINQVILNIIVNAAHAIEEKYKNNSTAKGLIIIESQNTGRYVQIKITDNGIGIPKNNLQKIFDPFFTTKAVGKGTGQGLSIAHDIIVNKHSGKILVESEYGKGTIFTIQLPVN